MIWRVPNPNRTADFLTLLMHMLPCRPMTTMMSRCPGLCFACSLCCLAVLFHTQQRRGYQSAERGLFQERNRAQERKKTSRRLPGMESIVGSGYHSFSIEICVSGWRCLGHCRRAAKDQGIGNSDGLLMLATTILQKRHRCDILAAINF